MGQCIAKEAEQEQKVRERTAPLTDEEQEEIHRLLRQGRDTDVVVSGFKVDMRRQDIRTCGPSTWLNDEVINFFMKLLKQRDDAFVAAAVARGEERRKNCFFNSFFISKLLDDHKGCMRRGLCAGGRDLHERLHEEGEQGSGSHHHDVDPEPRRAPQGQGRHDEAVQRPPSAAEHGDSGAAPCPCLQPEHPHEVRLCIGSGGSGRARDPCE